jgi:polysaccharide pyruvyl transferase WcaK-like protein
MPRTDINIGLLWHSANSGNLGVGALTLANMALAREACAGLGLTPRFTIIGMRDTGQYYVARDAVREVIVTTRSALDPRGCLAAIRAQDCILDIGGGDSFTDIYATRRYWFIWGLKALTVLARRPLFLSPQTIGPFSRQPQSAMAAWALRRSEMVMARDEPSAAEIQRLAPDAQWRLSTDVAFGLPFEDRSGQRNGPRPRVGINVSGLLFNEATLGANKFGLDVDYGALTHDLLEGFRARGCDVHLFTHCLDHRPWDDDGAVADKLAQQYPWAVRTPDFAGPSEAKSYISGLDFVVSGRMHACIGAVSSGTPVAPIAYSRKFKGVFDNVDYPVLVDVKGRSTDDARDFIFDCFERRDELAGHCRRSMAKVDGLLASYRAELGRLFEKARARA